MPFRIPETAILKEDAQEVRTGNIDVINRIFENIRIKFRQTQYHGNRIEEDIFGDLLACTGCFAVSIEGIADPDGVGILGTAVSNLSAIASAAGTAVQFPREREYPADCRAVFGSELLFPALGLFLDCFEQLVTDDGFMCFTDVVLRKFAVILGFLFCDMVCDILLLQQQVTDVSLVAENVVNHMSCPLVASAGCAAISLNHAIPTISSCASAKAVL